MNTWSRAADILKPNPPTKNQVSGRQSRCHWQKKMAGINPPERKSAVTVVIVTTSVSVILSLFHCICHLATDTMYHCISHWHNFSATYSLSLRHCHNVFFAITVIVTFLITINTSIFMSASPIPSHWKISIPEKVSHRLMHCTKVESIT